MNTPEISVIVPVYNVQDYLVRCVDSILAQTFRDFELILVDDGSTDRSGEMCDTLAGTDPRIRVIHKKNGGLSDARNAGIEAARGEYLSFIDSDDYAEPDMLAVLYGQIAAREAQVAVCGIYDCYENSRRPQHAMTEEYVCTGVEALERMLEGRSIPGSACNKLYSAALCRDRRFPVGKTYEDAFFLPEVLLACERVAVTTEPLYNYWHRAGSITSTVFSEKSFDMIDAYEYTLALVRDRLPDAVPAAVFRLWWAHFVVLDRMLEAGLDPASVRDGAVLARLRADWKQIVRCPLFSKGRRISAAALHVSLPLYKRISAMHRKIYGLNQ